MTARGATMPGAAIAPATGRSYWFCQAFGWGLYLGVTLVEVRAERSPGRFLEVIFAAVGGLALTHAYRSIIRRRGWLSLPLLAFALRALLAPIGLALVFVLPLFVVERYLLQDDPTSLAVVAAILRWTVVFVVWETLYFSVGLLRGRTRAEANRRELTLALAAARLRSLESQINPHFLFNALNSVRALVPDDPTAAQAAITQLASILRHALGAGRENLVTFASELRVVEDYLALEALRLGDRLRVERTIDAAALGVAIPALLLQTLVENAVKHGISELRDGGTLALSAKVEGATMLLRVENPRPKAAERVRSIERDNGVGLANATERLRLLFGEAARLQVDLADPDRATVEVRLPRDHVHA